MPTLSADDRLDITELIAAYGHAWAGGDIDRFVSHFIDDADVIGLSADVLHGHEQMKATLAPRVLDFKTNGRQPRHIMSGLLIDSASTDQAHISAYVLVVSTDTQTKVVTPRMTGTDTGDLVKQGGAWKIKHWTLTIESKVD